MFARPQPTVTVVAHSVGPQGQEILTFHIRSLRMIHADFMTHRDFSRNGRSSRAVPVPKLLAEPIYVPTFLEAQRGMQGGAEITGIRRVLAELVWVGMAKMTRLGVRALHKLGVNKQHANRPLEWFGWIDVLVTATRWENFYALRDHPDAQPEIQLIARLMKEAAEASTPRVLQPGEWHLPFVTDGERLAWSMKTLPAGESPTGRPPYVDALIKMCVARCARISYAPFDGRADFASELKRYALLVGSAPIHASPAEHQATPDRLVSERMLVKTYRRPELSGNLGPGWIQFRKLLPNECVKEAA